MRIKKILSRNRRDFQAVYECEHCKNTYEDSGYDDAHFHESVVPNMKCKLCKGTSPEGFQPLIPRYSADKIV